MLDYLINFGVAWEFIHQEIIFLTSQQRMLREENKECKRVNSTACVRNEKQNCNEVHRTQISKVNQLIAAATRWKLTFSDQN